MGLSALVRRKEVSAEELLDVAIRTIEARNPALNAVVQKMYDEARSRIARGLPDGPFRGVPFALKDLLAAYAGVPLRSGCEFFGDWAPREHSSLVKRYLDAGLVVLAKTRTAELGLLPMTESPLRRAVGSSG
jgi:amidase